MYKGLEHFEGLGLVRERLEAYEWSKVDWVTVRRGRGEMYAFQGLCNAPWNGFLDGISPSG